MARFRFFSTCKTAEEGKAVYKKLAREFHPDNGGNPEDMKALNAEFKIFWELFKDIHFDSATGQRKQATKSTTETAEEFIEIIANLNTIPDITIEATGSWLWIRGNTYPYRENLKSFGCRYSASKKCWYWAKDLGPKRGRRGTNMNDIRSKYGSENIEHKNPVFIG